MNKEFDRSLPSEIAIISDLLFECFEVAVHQILYIRNVYPKGKKILDGWMGIWIMDSNEHSI